MRWVVPGVLFLMAAVLPGAARPPRHVEKAEDTAPVVKVGGLTFVIPDQWTTEPPQDSARAAQWHIDPPRGQTGDGVEVVVFFFGPGIGGSAQENIDAWAGAITRSDGSPAAADPKTHETAGHKITEVTLSGSYAQPGSQPGVPPITKPAYGLLGAVVENTAGNIYWRMTGPAAQVTALAPVFAQVIDSLKPQDKP